MPNPIDLYWTWLAVADVRRLRLPRKPNHPRYMRAYTRVYAKFLHGIDLAEFSGRG